MPTRVIMIEYVPAMREGKRPASYKVSRDRAEQLVARGVCYWAGDGTRRIYERSTKPRGEAREWRKVPSAGYSVMQLIPLGRPHTQAPARAYDSD